MLRTDVPELEALVFQVRKEAKERAPIGDERVLGELGEELLVGEARVRSSRLEGERQRFLGREANAVGPRRSLVFCSLTVDCLRTRSQRQSRINQ